MDKLPRFVSPGDQGNYIYMIESDYVFMQPLNMPPPPDSMDARTDGWAFEFK